LGATGVETGDDALVAEVAESDGTALIALGADDVVQEASSIAHTKIVV